MKPWHRDSVLTIILGLLDTHAILTASPSNAFWRIGLLLATLWAVLQARQTYRDLKEAKCGVAACPIDLDGTKPGLLASYLCETANAFGETLAAQSFILLITLLPNCFGPSALDTGSPLYRSTPASWGMFFISVLVLLTSLGLHIVAFIRVLIVVRQRTHRLSIS